MSKTLLDVDLLGLTGNPAIKTPAPAWNPGASILSVSSYSSFGQARGGTSDLAVSWNAAATNATNTSGTGYTYRVSGDLASLYEQNGTHRWYVAPSGTAGTAVAFTQAMSLDNSGNLMVGTTTPRGLTTINAPVGAPGLSVTGKSSANVSADIEITRANTLANVGQGATFQFNDTATPTYSRLIQAGLGNFQFFGYGTGGWVEHARIDINGNWMVGRSAAAINVSRDIAVFERTQNGPTCVMINNQSTGASAATQIDFESYGGSWQIAVPASTANQNPLIFTSTHQPTGEKMRLTHDGNLLVGATTGSTHLLFKNVGEGIDVLYMGGTTATPTVGVKAVGSMAWSVTTAGMYLGKNTTSNRSLNAAGTINASGADYAEYMTKADDCGTIAKGQIVGVDADGRLTDKWSAAVSFLIKSTDPSYVGGDVWGREEALNMARPVEPVFEAPACTGAGAPGEDAGDEAQVAHAAALEAYRSALAEFDARLEAARERVDRMAFCGQVPVNVTGAVPGQYVVPVPLGDGIAGQLVDKADMSLAQYMAAVGIVQNILPDGRAQVRVKVV